MAVKKQKGLSDKEKMSIGVGLTAAAVAAAGAYFLAGSKKAAQNRKAVKSWALKAKAEVLEGLEKAQEMSQKEYEALIEQVGAAYAQVSKADLGGFKKEMKEHWQKIAKAAAPKKKSVKKVVATKAAAAVTKAATKAVAKKVAKPVKKSGAK